jgi:hypothetical protein
VVVGALGAFTACLYLIPFIMRIPFAFIGDFLIFFLWIVLFGIFGNVSHIPSLLFSPLLPIRPRKSRVRTDTNRLFLTDVHPRERRRRLGRPAHEECRLGRFDECIAVAIYGHVDDRLLVEGEEGEDDVYGEGEAVCLSSPPASAGGSKHGSVADAFRS